MVVQITVGPPVLTKNKSNTFLVTQYGGEVDPKQAQGGFSEDTRFPSLYRLRVNGAERQRVSSAVWCSPFVSLPVPRGARARC